MKTPLHRIRNGAMVLSAVFVISACGFRFFGGYDWIGAIWMVVVTISTVGYSEQSAQSQAMQGFTVLVIILGISASVYTVGGLIQLMLEGELERIIGTRRMTQEISKLSGHIIVCGYGRMGQDLAEELRHRHQTVVIVEANPTPQSESTNHSYIVYAGDATSEDVLLSVGVDRAKCLVSALPSDAENVFITLTARNLNPNLQIISRAEQQSTEKKLLQAGASSVVMPTVAGARQMVRMITHPATAHLMELVSQSGFEDMELDEIEITESSEFAGSEVADIEAWRKNKLLVVAVKRPSGEYTFNPTGGDTFQTGDVVVMMGHRKDIQRFRKELVDAIPEIRSSGNRQG